MKRKQIAILIFKLNGLSVNDVELKRSVILPGLKGM